MQTPGLRRVPSPEATQIAHLEASRARYRGVDKLPGSLPVECRSPDHSVKDSWTHHA